MNALTVTDTHILMKLICLIKHTIDKTRPRCMLFGLYFKSFVIAGVPHGRDVDYVIGYPFYNDTLGNITGIVPEQTEWTYIDRNMSEFMQDTWMNFTKYGFDLLVTCCYLHAVFSSW